MNDNKQHIFIIGSKSIGQYGGFESFVECLITQHKNISNLQYHIACKANGEGHMDFSNIDDVKRIKRLNSKSESEYIYKNAHVFLLKCPNIGAASAISYDKIAMEYAISFCREQKISSPIFYLLSYKIGLYIDDLASRIHSLGGKLYVNPDGMEWKRSKWPLPVKLYWKWSEKKTILSADYIVCDSSHIRKYVKNTYAYANPKTAFIPYGCDTSPSSLQDDSLDFKNWLKATGAIPNEYYLVVGRFVPENNYLTILQEYMRSNTNRKLILITNKNDRFMKKLKKITDFPIDHRIVFSNSVYNKELLKKIRENAYGYIHGHEVGGTNPSLLEGLASTGLCLLFDVGFNREVGRNACFYWSKSPGSLSKLIDKTDQLSPTMINEYKKTSISRIHEAYSPEIIGEKYVKIWNLNKNQTN